MKLKYLSIHSKNNNPLHIDINNIFIKNKYIFQNIP